MPVLTSVVRSEMVPAVLSVAGGSPTRWEPGQGKGSSGLCTPAPAGHPFSTTPGHPRLRLPLASCFPEASQRHQPASARVSSACVGPGHACLTLNPPGCAAAPRNPSRPQSSPRLLLPQLLGLSASSAISHSGRSETSLPTDASREARPAQTMRNKAPSLRGSLPEPPAGQTHCHFPEGRVGVAPDPSEPHGNAGHCAQGHCRAGGLGARQVGKRCFLPNAVVAFFPDRSSARRELFSRGAGVLESRLCPLPSPALSLQWGDGFTVTSS